MMEEMCYTAQSLAILISIRELSGKETSRFLEMIWRLENNLLAPVYRDDFRKLILDTHYWMHYFFDKPILDDEFPSIQKDLLDVGSAVDIGYYRSDFSDLDLFFQNLRIRIIFDGTKDYVRMKLRTLLKAYGYRRRSKLLMDYISRCMKVFQLKAYLRGGVECEIKEVGIDEMLIFRIY